jgi:hypothetical protein
LRGNKNVRTQTFKNHRYLRSRPNRRSTRGDFITLGGICQEGGKSGNQELGIRDQEGIVPQVRPVLPAPVGAAPWPAWRSHLCLRHRRGQDGQVTHASGPGKPAGGCVEKKPFNRGSGPVGVRSWRSETPSPPSSSQLKLLTLTRPRSPFNRGGGPVGVRSWSSETPSPPSSSQLKLLTLTRPRSPFNRGLYSESCRAGIPTRVICTFQSPFNRGLYSEIAMAIRLICPATRFNPLLIGACIRRWWLMADSRAVHSFQSPFNRGLYSELVLELNLR